MATTTCGMQVHVNCDGNDSNIEFTNTSGQVQEAIAHIPPGGSIVIDGDVVFENQTGDVKKAHLKIPSA